jgi:hypothetical protein
LQYWIAHYWTLRGLARFYLLELIFQPQLLEGFFLVDSAVREEVADLEAELQKNRLEIDGLETKIADISAKLDQLPALLDRQQLILAVDFHVRKNVSRILGESFRTLPDSSSTFAGSPW